MGTLLTPIQHFRDFELQHAWPIAMWKHQRVFLITPREYFDPPICCIFFSLLMGYGFFLSRGDFAANTKLITTSKTI